jgi:hypothetical protein
VATPANAAPVDRARIVLPVACVLFAGFTVLVVDAGTDPPTSYAATSTEAHIVNDVTGVALLIAAAISAIVRPRGSIAPLTAAIGVAWLAPDWAGWDDGRQRRRHGDGGGASAAAIIAHLVLAYRRGGQRPAGQGVHGPGLRHRGGSQRRVGTVS